MRQIFLQLVLKQLCTPYWDDLYTGGTIKYELLGAAPNQYMVISFENINHINYQASGATFQVVLYETTNNIRIQYTTQLWKCSR
jgi:hypothetical protein